MLEEDLANGVEQSNGMYCISGYVHYIKLDLSRFEQQIGPQGQQLIGVEIVIRHFVDGLAEKWCEIVGYQSQNNS